MSNPIEAQIFEAEERLRLAMLDSDVKVLNELLAFLILDIKNALNII